MNRVTWTPRKFLNDIQWAELAFVWLSPIWGTFTSIHTSHFSSKEWLGRVLRRVFGYSDLPTLRSGWHSSMYFSFLLSQEALQIRNIVNYWERLIAMGWGISCALWSRRPRLRMWPVWLWLLMIGAVRQMTRFPSIESRHLRCVIFSPSPLSHRGLSVLTFVIESIPKKKAIDIYCCLNGNEPTVLSLDLLSSNWSGFQPVRKAFRSSIFLISFVPWNHVKPSRHTL